jgi:hypothetical protein
MDHRERHHEEHRAEREKKKKEKAEHDRQEERKPGAVHPGWFFAIGFVLILLVVLVWILVV